jgi:hypothetical protein
MRDLESDKVKSVPSMNIWPNSVCHAFPATALESLSIRGNGCVRMSVQNPLSSYLLLVFHISQT